MPTQKITRLNCHGFDCLFSRKRGSLSCVLKSPPNTWACNCRRQLSSARVHYRCSRETVRELAIAGAGAVVLPSLFEEQIVHYMLDNDMPAEEDEATVEQRGYRESTDQYNGGPVAYLKAIGDLKQVTSVPIVANLNGCTRGNWLRFAGDLESSGADALELNLRLDTSDPSLGSEAVEENFLDCVRTVCDAVAIPVSVKLSPYFTCLTNLAWRLVEAGASGLVIFGREARYEVQLDRLARDDPLGTDACSYISETLAGLIRVRAGGPDISVAACGGICSASDANKTIIAGADVAMVTSEIYREGPEVVAHIIDGMISFLERNRIESFSQLVRTRPKPTPLALGRSDYLQPLTERTAYDDPRRDVPPTNGRSMGTSDRITNSILLSRRMIPMQRSIAAVLFLASTVMLNFAPCQGQDAGQSRQATDRHEADQLAHANEAG